MKIVFILAIIMNILSIIINGSMFIINKNNINFIVVLINITAIILIIKN